MNSRLKSVEAEQPCQVFWTAAHFDFIVLSFYHFFPLLLKRWPFLSVSPAYHISSLLWSTFMWQRRITRINFAVYPYNKIKFQSVVWVSGGFKVRNTVQLTYLCRGHVCAGWSTRGSVWAKLGDPLHPITAGEWLVGQWWAAGSVTLAVTVCDPGVAWQAAGLPRGLRGSLVRGSRGKWAGEGAVADRTPVDYKKGREAQAASPQPGLACSQLRQMLYVDSVTQMLQEGYL